MKYKIDDIVTVSLPGGCYEGKVHCLKKSFSKEQLYEVHGNKPKLFVTVTSARSINTGEKVGLYSAKECKSINP